jgi:hypothetical protein
MSKKNTSIVINTYDESKKDKPDTPSSPRAKFIHDKFKGVWDNEE